jgi:murein DD-endopeptidase MepM/ murein hydrolase activator NlpD
MKRLSRAGKWTLLLSAVMVGGFFAGRVYERVVHPPPGEIDLVPSAPIGGGSAPAATRGTAGESLPDTSEGGRGESRVSAPPVDPAGEPRLESPPGSDETEPSAGVPTSSNAILELRDRHLTLPVEGVLADALAPGFEQLRGGRRHEAIDIPAPRGTPVLAVENGIVAKLFNSRQGGLTIYQFDPSTRYAYYYAHLDRYADGLQERSAVHRGQVIGFVGSSGNASESFPHLHFAIFVLTPDKRWWVGTSIDPYRVWRS